MKQSGESVTCQQSKPDRAVEKLVGNSYDLANPLGPFRLRTTATHGGQNGLRSIIDCLRTNEFIRLRIGIMPEHPISNTKNFVLENFAKGEIETVENILERSADAIRSVVSEGIEKAMAKFN
jgi:PTH1 family peptidyl-tRNA hydrolase